MKKIIIHLIFMAVLLASIIICSLKVYGGNKTGDISGTVFEDTNRNLQLDPGEKGISGILVSNRHEVVRTDTGGQYHLQFDEDESVVFVIKPPGFSFPLNKNNLPLFYYMHNPENSPVKDHREMQPARESPGMVNFPLYRTVEKDSFNVIILADPQPRDHEELGYVRDDIVAELAGTGALFGITLGDIMFDDLSLYGRYNEIISKIEIPFYNVPGNHDADYDALANKHSLETYKHWYGPDYYAFEYGKINFIVLNTVHWMDDPGIIYHRSYEGKVGEDQLQWLKNYLQFVPPDELIVLCMHIPLYSYSSDIYQENVVDRNKLFNILQDRSHLLALAGHLHTLENNYLDETAGWTSGIPFHQVSCAAVCGSWWRGPKDERGIPAAVQLSDGTLNGYHVFHFEGNNYSQRFKAAGKDENYQIRISAPRGIISKNKTNDLMITINFFNGNDKSVVVCQTDNNEPVQMRMTTMKDPYAEQLFHDYTDLYDDWIGRGPTRHMWVTALPADLEPGVHKIVVSATDEYGINYKQSTIFEIF